MKHLFAAAACAATMATGAFAATANVDFVALSNTTPGEGFVEGMTFNYGDLGVTVSASSFFGADAYLDSSNNQGDAGLGACVARIFGNPEKCSAISADHVNGSDVLTLSFDRAVDLSHFSFSKAGHGALNSGKKFKYAINGGSNMTSKFNVGITETGVTSLTLSAVAGFLGGKNFYLAGFQAAYVPDNQNNPIPLPAGLPLLAGALGMLAFAKRRKTS